MPMPKPLDIERVRQGHTGDGVRYVLIISLGCAAVTLALLTAAVIR